MTAVDWIIIAFVALMALWGYGQGLVVSGLSLAGFAAGAFAGSRLAPLLLEQGSRSPYAPLFSLVTALLVGGVAAIVFEAVGVGHPTPAVVPARGGRGRHRRRDAGRDARPRPGVDPGRGRAADARRAPVPQGHPALRDPAPAERGAASVGPDPERARARRPVPADHGARGRCPAAQQAHPARRRRARCARAASCACSAPRAGSRSRDRDGWPRRTWWSPTRTSSRGRTTRR